MSTRFTSKCTEFIRKNTRLTRKNNKINTKSPQSSHKFVIARYNEDISWLEPIMDNSIIYNKGNPLFIDNEILSPNVGRESHAYLQYIIDNYTALPDVVVFTQASIADHLGKNDPKILIKLQKQARKFGFSKNFEIFGPDNIYWNGTFNYNERLYADGWYLKDNYKNGKILFKDWFENTLECRYNHVNYIYPAAIFAVQKDHILKRSLNYYKKLIKHVDWDTEPIEAHFFERSWFYIFDIKIDINNYDVIIVGSGLSGAVLAERFASVLDKSVLVIDKRDHIGGNCYDYIDENGILVNKYGAHLFHTNDEEVWNYVTNFSEWNRYEHKTLGYVDDKFVPIPVNITTVNMLCNENLQTESEMKEWLKNNTLKYEEINNGEEMAKSRVGQKLYEKIFRQYTYKQWNKYPEQLLPDVLARIPIYSSFDDRYFTDKYQALPKYGYTKFFEKLLDHENIEVHLNIDYKVFKKIIPPGKIVIYTGPIDQYFSDSGLNKLEYRSINFVKESYNMNYYQPTGIVNYPQNNVDFTRIVEYKHFNELSRKSKKTTIVKEYSSSDGEPYYPILSKENIELYDKYKKLAEAELKNNIHFVGRLANYKYFNMDQAIKNSLDYFKKYFQKSLIINE